MVYRWSPKSITMRCDRCGLQWMMTLNKIHWALKAERKAKHKPDETTALIKALIKATRFAAERKAVAR